MFVKRNVLYQLQRKACYATTVVLTEVMPAARCVTRASYDLQTSSENVRPLKVFMTLLTLTATIRGDTVPKRRWFCSKTAKCGLDDRCKVSVFFRMVRKRRMAAGVPRPRLGASGAWRMEAAAVGRRGMVCGGARIVGLGFVRNASARTSDTNSCFLRSKASEAVRVLPQKASTLMPARDNAATTLFCKATSTREQARLK